MDHRLFLVEDDPRLVRALSDLLGNHGHTLRVATDGALAFEIAKSEPFDLIILDVMLPSMSGLEICSELRRAGIDTPILMLTARDQAKDKVAGFRSGTDDYLTKPFDMDELQLRIEALIRRVSRTARSEPSVYEFGEVRVNLASLQVFRSGWTFSLSERECRLLRYFLENRGKTISRDTLLEQVWGYNTAPYTRTVDVHILRLRQKVEDDPKNPRFIITVHGLGYRFDG